MIDDTDALEPIEIVGSAGGLAIYKLPPDAEPDGFVSITAKAGAYDLTQPVELGSIESKPVLLTVT